MNRLLKILLGIAIISVVGLLGYYSYLSTKFSQQQPKGDTARIAEKEKERARDDIVMKVGNENIYQGDIEYNLRIFHPQATGSATAREAAIRDIQEKIVIESIILQEGEKMKFTTLSAKVYNSPEKDIVERNKLIDSLKTKISNAVVNKISGESISIWFHNQSYPEPKMGYEKARQVAKEKIDAIYADLVAKKITFNDAAKKIFFDTSLRDVDPNYEANAYFKFENRPESSPLFVNPKTHQAALSLKEGETSPVLTITDKKNDSTGQEYEAFFRIIHIVKKTGDGYAGLEDWYKAKKQSYAVKIY